MGQATTHMGGRVIIEQLRWHRYHVTIPECDIVKAHLPSVTQSIDMLNKPALVQWAANQAADKMLDLRDAHVESVLASMPPEMRNRAVMIPASVLDSWQNDVRFKFRDAKRKAAEIGSVAHDYLEAHLKWVHHGALLQPQRPVVGDLTQEQVDMANNAIDAGLAWFKEHHIELIATETMLCSPFYGVAGRQDWKMRVDGELCNGDFKSGSGIYDEVWLQLAAYKMMEQELDPKQKIEASWAIHINKKTAEFSAVRRDDKFFESDWKAFDHTLGIHLWKEWEQEGKPLPPSGIILTPAKAKRATRLVK